MNLNVKLSLVPPCFLPRITAKWPALSPLLPRLWLWRRGVEDKRLLEGFMLGGPESAVGGSGLSLGEQRRGYRYLLVQPEVTQCTVTSPLPAPQPLSNTREVMALRRTGRLRPDTGWGPVLVSTSRSQVMCSPCVVGRTLVGPTVGNKIKLFLMYSGLLSQS